MGLLFPGAVKIISHHVQEVEVLGHARDIVTLIDVGLTGRNGGTQHHPVGVQSILEV